jgi:FKBP-type peptidyl-prolyl cis-trans isomerase FkpA/FKBP-type peptidyl-prolyl cis-trans isomerase FklB
MRHFLAPAIIVATLVIPAACAKQPAAATAPKLATDDDKTLYALGVLMSRSLESFELSPQEVELVKQGLGDALNGKPTQVDADKMTDNVQNLYKKRMDALVQKDKDAGTAYLAKAAAEPGATKTASGIVIKTITPGTGPSPAATDEVKVHYEGTLVNGKVFDSSIKRGEPATFPLNGVIPCWTEAVQTMKVGGKSRIVCPSDLAYGERGSPPTIRPNNTLIFDVQLLDIVKPGANQGGGAAPQANPHQ